MKRATGFYWVKYNDEWIVAKYVNPVGIWLICGENAYWNDEDFSAINEDKL